MFTYGKPEEVGISSKNIKRYLEVLEKAGLSTHDVIIARHDKIVYENYWAPFHKDFLHRMYSVTKSFVSLAIGCLEEEGKLNLEDKIVDLFPAEITEGAHENVKKQTVKNMLMMSTGFPGEKGFWFKGREESRLRNYFKWSGEVERDTKEPGTIFDYDSYGSFVLGALVEQLSGMTLMDYLRSKVLDKIGFSKDAYFLQCPGGNSWGDSALMCTAQDLLKAAKFTMNLGCWDGEQLMSREYLKAATSNLISTHYNSHPANRGYGYQFWRLQQNSFCFNGMGCQFGICIPDKDMVFVYNGDNQGNDCAKVIVIDNFYNLIVDEVQDSLKENPQDYDDLMNYSRTLELFRCQGNESENVQDFINGKTYVLNENPMGIKWIRLSFKEKGGVMEYENEQGEKKLPFGMEKNVFCKFPQEGYSDLVGGIPAPGHYHDCAVSAQWQTANLFYLSVQIIDKYFGRLHIYLYFTAHGTIAVRMKKTAEDFLYEYEGDAKGSLKE